MNAGTASPGGAGNQTPLLSFRAVTQIYDGPGGPVAALRGISFDLRRGEFCAVTGPSGSGKTTLLHLAALLATPTSGEVWFEGEATARLSERERAARRARRIGMIFQRFHLLPHRTVWDNILFRFRYLPAMSRSDVRERARSALEAVGLAAKVGQRARLLSGGEMQRVAIARAIVWPPALLAADEPTGNLDRESAQKVLQLLRDFQRRGATVLLATHNESLLRPGDRWLRLEVGELIADERR